MSRKRYVYTSGGRPLAEPIEVDLDWRNPGHETPHRSEEEVYGHLVAQDGTDLSTRTKHREYMKRNNLSLAEDMTQTWEKARKEREDFYTGRGSTREHKEAVAESVRMLRERRRR